MTSKIHSKVIASTSAALVTVLVWVAAEWFGVDVPTEVAGALVVIVTALAGYFKTETVR